MTKFFNATLGPVRIDSEGRVVGGQEWFEHIYTPELEELIENNQVVVVENNSESEEE